MIREGVFSLSVFLVVIVALAIAIPSGFAGDNQFKGKGINSFGRCVAGSYLEEFELFGIPHMKLVTIGADGTLFAEVTYDFGDGVPVAFKSGHHGTCVRTGKREISCTSLHFDYDLEGVLASIVRNAITMTFDKHCLTFSRYSETDVLLPGQDPLDPNEMPLLSLSGSAEGRRIPAVME